jgi:Fe-S-cluster-containing hydrogenase component 2
MKTPLVYHINETLCINCGSCRRFCPVDTITYEHLQHQVDMTGCIGCTICYAVCPADAVEITRGEDARKLKLLSTTTRERVCAHTWVKGPFYQFKRRQEQKNDASLAS